MRIHHSFLALVILVSVGCSSQTQPPPAPGETVPLTEKNRIEVDTRPIDGAPPTHQLRARRLDDVGHRVIEHFDGMSWATFFPETEPLIPLNMEAVYRGGETLICAQALEQTATLDGLRVVCAVRADGAAAFAQRGTVEGEPSAWLHDVCAGDGGQFTLLVSAAASPLATGSTAAALEQLPCGSLTWDGTAWTGTPNTACMCAQLDGQPCEDPCYVGTGTWRDGRCELAGLTARCDDGDPTTADYCTGDPSDLCMHERGAEMLAP